MYHGRNILAYPRDAQHITNVDPHVHYVSPDSRKNKRHPKRLLSHAQQQGLQWIAVSDHGSMKGIRQMRDYAANYGIGVIPAVELYCRVPNRTIALSFRGRPTLRIIPQMPHMVAIMPPQRDIPFGRSVDTIGNYVQKKGGILIAAHPKENGDFQSLDPGQVLDYYKRGVIHAAETHSEGSSLPWMEKIALAHSIPTIGSSDAHRPRMSSTQLVRQLFSLFVNDFRIVF